MCGINGQGGGVSNNPLWMFQSSNSKVDLKLDTGGGVMPLVPEDDVVEKCYVGNGC